MIIAIGGQKGGSGKSTSAIAIAAEFNERGYSVLLIDGDPQQTTRIWGSIGAQEGHETPTVIGIEDPAQFKDLGRIAANYEITVIDCPGRDGALQRAAFLVSHLVLLPCGPMPADTWALTTTIAILQRVRFVREDLDIAALITRKSSRTQAGRAIRGALEDMGLDVLRATLGYRVAYQDMLGAGCSITGAAPSSTAANEVRLLVNELETRLQEDVKDVA